MGEPMTTLPTKITPDAIREALFEMRFEHSVLPEIVIGQLAGNAKWRGFSQGRLPISEMPEQLRSADPALRYLPTLELRSPDGGELVRIGSNVVSYHVVSNYVGWDAFLPRLIDMGSAVLNAAPGVKLMRLGLRYINALTKADHFVGAVYDLNLRINIDGAQPAQQIQLAYLVEDVPGLTGIVRVVSPRFVEGDMPAGTAAVIDIDIASGANVPSADIEAIQIWLVAAHETEKREFFSLLTQETLEKLTRN